MRKEIRLNHHMDDYECMWNGIEDLYIKDTKETLPPSFFFSMSSFGAFCYLNTPKNDLKKLITIGDGRTRKMYEFLAPIIGLEYKFREYSSFEALLKDSKKEIDAGYPCVLGALDMFHLPHFTKIYHHEHIPFHYEMMTGYDDELKEIIILDCGRSNTLSLSYDELKQALDCSSPGLSKPNTMCTIRLKSTKNKYELAKESLHNRGEVYLNPPVSFIGHKGFEKFITDLPKLSASLGKNEFDKILYNMVQFLGTVPTVPNKLKGINDPDQVEFFGGFDKMAVSMEMIGIEYKDHCFIDASTILKENMHFVAEAKEAIVDYLTEGNDRVKELVLLFTKMNNALIDFYKTLLE